MADQVYFRCSICRSVPEIFAIKVESCQKSRRYLDGFFGPPKFFGAGPKVVHALSPVPRGTSSGGSFMGISLPAPKLLTLIR